MPAQWNVITASEIIKSVNGELLAGGERTTFSGLSTDSREISRGQLFWPLKGEKHDGHHFISIALEKGAAGIIADKNYTTKISFNGSTPVIAVEDTLKALGDFAAWWRRQYSLQIAAITGSTGKTTTKEMAAGILNLGAPTLKNEGNFNNLIGLPLTLLQLNNNHCRAVLEMGMNRPGEIGRLTEITDPSIGLITNIAKVHLAGLGDINGVARAKAELIEKISSDHQLILNGDDELLLKTASHFQRKTMTFGLGSKNDVRAINIENQGLRGMTFVLLYHETKMPIKLRVPGAQNMINALAASAIALSMEVPWPHIVEGLHDYEGIKGRFKPYSLKNGVTLVDDTYNSNPYSLRAALKAIKDMKPKKGRTIICLGQMSELGEETGLAHREAGALIASMGGDYLLVMGESASEVIEGAMKNGFHSGRVKKVSTHREMAQEIKEIIKPDDLILLKGSRIMELERVSKLLLENGSEEGKNDKDK